MRLLLTTLAASLLATQLACCSTQVTAAGYQRSCVPLFGWHRPRADAPPPPPAAAPTAPFAVAWDDELGIYAVADHPCHFLRLDTVYRRLDARWWMAASIDGPWREIDAAALPPGFRFQLAAERCDQR